MTRVRRSREGAGLSLPAAGPVPEARRERVLRGVLDAVQFPLTRLVRSVADQLTRQVGGNAGSDCAPPVRPDQVVEDAGCDCRVAVVHLGLAQYQ